MTAGPDGPRLPRSEGQHIFSCGGTGTGKTTSALRVVAARALHDHSAVLAIDQKGDEQAEQMLRDIAARGGRTFILIDPRSPDTDRWQPISGDVGEIVARTVEPIKASEEYYSDMLRLYLGVVASGFGFFLWNKGSRAVDEGILAVMNNMKIPVGVVAGLAILGERQDWRRLLAGCVLIGAALCLNERKKRGQA